MKVKSIDLQLTVVFLCLLVAISFPAIALFDSVNAVSLGNNTNDDDNNLPNKLTPRDTPNQIAAGGSIPPNYTIVEQEKNCVMEEVNEPWYPTIQGYEHHNSNRTHLYECATFTGSFTEPNDVYAYQSPDFYYTPSMIATQGTNEMYVYGGASANAVPLPTNSYVAKVEPGTLKELWRTVLVNSNISGIWTGAGSIEMVGGNIFAITNTYLYKINSTTGEVKGMLSLPTGESAPRDSYFNGMGGWPDGTLVMKNLARAPGCDIQGFFALSTCPNLDQTPPSAMVAVDPQSFEIIDWVQLEEMIGGRITATNYDGNNYAYVAGQENLFRYQWDGKNLTLDATWGPISYLLPGQTSASACGILNEWVICMTNGLPTQTPLSVIAISQANASNIHRIEPIPLNPGQISNIPSMPAIDPENSRIYAMDGGPGKTVGIDIDQNTGNMTLAWTADQNTLSWFALIGPAEQRVLVGTNIKSNVTNSTEYQIGPKGSNYVEQVQWRNADTGELLAASDFFGPMVVGMQVWPGYGGLVYDGLNEGHIMALKVLPQTNMTSSSMSNITTTNTATVTGSQNSAS